MAEQGLTELEAVSGSANQAYVTSYENMSQAAEKANAANETYKKTMLYGNHWQRKEALEAKMAADAELESAQAAFDQKCQEAQAAADAVEEKKKELIDSRTTDMTYVVYGARINCNYGMRDSYLLLDNVHGVYTGGAPQMTVMDYIMDVNIVDFGGCKSAENPTTIQAAKDAVEAAGQAIKDEKASKPFLTWLTGFFVKDEDIPSEMSEDMISECMGQCIAEFVSDTGWMEGQEKVTINGEAPLLRRCELSCIYGGLVTILLSGQQE